MINLEKERIKINHAQSYYHSRHQMQNLIVLIISSLNFALAAIAIPAARKALGVEAATTHDIPVIVPKARTGKAIQNLTMFF